MPYFVGNFVRNKRSCISGYEFDDQRGIWTKEAIYLTMQNYLD